MGFESGKESEHESASVLETFKDNPDAPFVTVGKNEELTGYPYPFQNKLSSSWSKVCELMDWKKEGQAVDWNFFKVSKNPFDVVTSIQEKILSEGGELPRYGMDGKFGHETQDALNDVISRKAEQMTAQTQVEVVEDSTTTAPHRTDRVLSTETVGTEKVEKGDPIDNLMQQKMPEIIEALPRIEARLKAAGLKIDRDWLKNPDFSDTDVIEFQTRAMQFREDLIEEEPRLAPLNQVMLELIPMVEAEIRKIDLSKINNIEDLVRTIDDIGKAIESKTDSMEDILSDEKMEELINEVDIEILMSFFMTLYQEFVVLMVRYFKGNKQNFERIMRIFKDEGLVS